MSDYIKDLNIVDFLGIIVPGSILVLLIAGDNAPLFLLWSSYFGADASPLVRGIFLAIAGYLAGMILHEIGDLAEKGAWCFPCLDPKAYAINAVGINNLSTSFSDSNIKADVSPNQRCVLPSFMRGILGCSLAFLILASCTVGFSMAMSSAANDATVPQASVDVVQNTNTSDSQDANVLAPTTSADIQTSAPTQPSAEAVNPTIPETPASKVNSLGAFTYVVSILALVLLLISLSVIAQILRSKNQKEKADQNQNPTPKDQNPPPIDQNLQKDDSDTSAASQTQWDILKQLCLQNPQIQTYIAQNGAIPKKMSMFDSFRHVMRNLLIAVAIINAFSIWHPIDLYRDVAAYFVNAGNITIDFGVLTGCFCFVILFAFSRYSHFVFLRYKYSYEAFINNVPPKTDSDVAQHHIVLECKNQIQKNP